MTGRWDKHHSTPLPVIEQAKGVLMACYSIDAGAAFGALLRWSEDNDTALITISAGVTDAVQRPAPQHVGDLDTFVQRLGCDGRAARSSWSAS